MPDLLLKINIVENRRINIIKLKFDIIVKVCNKENIFSIKGGGG